MAAALIRYLLITNRRIPVDRSEDYARMWHAVRASAERAGARAWIFTSQAAGDRFIEFVEWQSSPDDMITNDANLQAALRDLDATFAAEDSDTWMEARI